MDTLIEKIGTPKPGGGPGCGRVLPKKRGSKGVWKQKDREGRD